MIISLMLLPLLLWHLGPGPPLYSSLLILLPLLLLLGVFPSRALIQAITSYSQGGMIWSLSIIAILNLIRLAYKPIWSYLETRWTASMSLISLISLLTLSSCHLRSSLLLKVISDLNFKVTKIFPISRSCLHSRALSLSSFSLFSFPAR